MKFSYFLIFKRESLKAVDAAIYSRQWKKAVEILQTQDGNSTLIYYKKIADHFASVGEIDVNNFEIFDRY
jgi:hypothetical protein